MSRSEERDPRVRRTRAAVLDVAVQLLVEGGTPAVTIEAIVQRSGVARSTIYRHWPSRVDVVAAALGRLVAPLPPPPAHGDLRSRLTVVLRGLATQMTDERYAASVPAILDSARRDPELAAFRPAFVRAQTGPLVAILTDAVDRGDLPPGLDVDDSIAQLVGPMFFRRVVLAQEVGDADADAATEGFLQGHARP